MPQYSCEGIVLRARRIDESDRLIHFFTNRFGRIRVKARGITRTKSSFGSIAEAFSHDHLNLYTPRENRDVLSLTKASTINTNQQLRQDLPRYYAATFVAEMLDCCTQDNDPNHSIWQLLLDTLNHLSNSQNLRCLLLAFQLKVFPFLGVAINLQKCCVCSATSLPSPVAFSGRMGGPLCNLCRKKDASAIMLSDDLYRIFLIAAQYPMEASASLDMPQEMWLTTLRALRAFWENHLEFNSKSRVFIETEI